MKKLALFTLLLAFNAHPQVVVQGTNVQIGSQQGAIGPVGRTGAKGDPGTVTATGVNGDFSVPGTLTVGKGAIYRQLNAFGDSYTCSVQMNVSLRCLAQNLGGYGATTPANSWIAKFATVNGYASLPAINNYAGGGAEACDVSATQVAANYIPGGGQLNTVMGTLNDAINHGAGLHEQTTTKCINAAILRTALPAENMVAAPSCTIAGGTTDNTYPQMPGVHFSGAGGVTCTVTTTGGPLYFWYMMKDGSSGSFIYAVSGATTIGPTTVTTAPPDTIHTAVGGITQAPGLIRIPSINPGLNTIAFTSTSDTTIYAVGWAPASAKGPANTIVGGTAILANNATPSTANYNADLVANWGIGGTFIADGIAARFADVRSVMGPFPGLFLDGVHPLDEMYGWIATVFADAIYGAQSVHYPVITDSASPGTWPYQLYMATTGTTGFGPQWITDNTTQGGRRLNHDLVGPGDATAALGCEVLYDMGANTLERADCPTNHIFAHQVIAPGYSGKGTAAIDVQSGAGTGATAACDTGRVCDSVSGVIALVAGSSPGSGQTDILHITVQSHPQRASCVVTLNPDVGSGLSSVPAYFGGATSTTLIQVYTYSALTAGGHYVVAYWCGN